MFLDERTFGFTLILVLSASSAFAYVDPGSGALVWQLAVSALLGGLFIARKALWRVLRLLGFKRERPQAPPPNDK